MRHFIPILQTFFLILNWINLLMFVSLSHRSICILWYPLIKSFLSQISLISSILPKWHSIETCQVALLWDIISLFAAAAAAKLLQSCPTLCDPRDSSPPGFPIPGILQARTLEWVTISFSNAWKWKVKVKSLSRVWLLATPWTAAYQAPLSMDFPGKSTGVGCHCLLRSAYLSPS